MAFIPAVNVVQLSLHMLLNGQRVENSVYVTNNTPPGDTDLTLLADLVATWWDEDIAPYLTTQISLQEVVARDLTTEASSQISFTTGLPVSGDVAADALPNNCAMLVTFKTSFPGRAYRGGNYVAGFGEGAAIMSTWGTSITGGVKEAYEALNERFDVVGFHMVVISRYEVLVENGPSVPRDTALISNVVSFKTSPYVVSQKRRLPGRGI